MYITCVNYGIWYNYAQDNDHTDHNYVIVCFSVYVLRSLSLSYYCFFCSLSLIFCCLGSDLCSPVSLDPHPFEK